MSAGSRTKWSAHFRRAIVVRAGAGDHGEQYPGADRFTGVADLSVVTGLRAALPAFSVEDVADCLRRGARLSHVRLLEVFTALYALTYRVGNVDTAGAEHGQDTDGIASSWLDAATSASAITGAKRPHYDRGDRRSPPDRDRWRPPRRHRRRSS